MLQDTNSTAKQKQTALYYIYLRYFQQISGLPYKHRRKLKADKYIKQMKSLIKSGSTQQIDTYWILFAKRALPFFAISFLGELLMLNGLNTPFIMWKVAIGGTAFLTGLILYFVAAYEIEGVRFFSSLSKWIQYSAHPRDHSRPLDMIQTLKTLFPLAVTIASVCIKFYFK